jgi:uncharacterized protein (DUF39 family)
VTTLSQADYVVSKGTYASNTQTTTLTVKAAANTVDSEYICAITSSEYSVINRETAVTLNVFGKGLINIYTDSYLLLSWEIEES